MTGNNFYSRWWNPQITRQYPINRPFTLRGKNACLLEVLECGDAQCLRIVYEPLRSPARVTSTIRDAIKHKHSFDCYDHILGVRTNDREYTVLGSRVGRFAEFAEGGPLLADIISRVEASGHFGQCDVGSLHLGDYILAQKLPMGHHRLPELTIFFDQMLGHEYIEAPCMVPKRISSSFSIPYDIGGDARQLWIRHLQGFALASDADFQELRKRISCDNSPLLAALRSSAGPDDHCFLLEHNTPDEVSKGISVYAADYLDQPAPANKAVRELNRLLSRQAALASSRKQCIGLLPDTRGETLPVEVFCRSRLLPRQSVVVRAEEKSL